MANPPVRSDLELFGEALGRWAALIVEARPEDFSGDAAHNRYAAYSNALLGVTQCATKVPPKDQFAVAEAVGKWTKVAWIWGIDTEEEDERADLESDSGLV